MTETFKEVQACRKAGIMINTFMLASDYYLVDFVKQMSAMTNGKAYFANPGNLSQFVLIDFLLAAARAGSIGSKMKPEKPKSNRRSVKLREEGLRQADQRAVREYERLLDRISCLAQALGTARELFAILSRPAGVLPGIGSL